MKLEIKEIISNMVDELNRADGVLTWLYTEHPEVYSEIQNSELGDVLTQDIRDELDRTDDLLERIDLAMLMSAQVKDVAIPTIYQIYETEKDIELPYDGDYVDTETVYNMIDKWCMQFNNNKIIIAFAKSSKYFTDDFNAEGTSEIHTFDTPQEFLDKWEELMKEGHWYWVLDGDDIVCSGVCEPDDIEIFEDYWNI